MIYYYTNCKNTECFLTLSNYALFCFLFWGQAHPNSLYHKNLKIQTSENLL